MNKNITFRSIFAALVFLCAVLSCTKEGAVGPQGEAGEQGETGADGSRMYSGADAPAASLGHEGDFYFRSSNSDFYGPKTGSGWGNPTNLRGAAGTQGPAGTSGSKILSGTAVPSTTTGAVGDFYFRSTTGDFYGPRTSNGWGTPINLKGVKGEDGSRIYSGTTAPSTALGSIGDFYFRTTSGDFYGPKTNSGWGTPSNLKGATGATGAAGSKILSGASVPVTTQGAIGDYYIHTATADLYGPKTTNGWGSPILNLKEYRDLPVHKAPRTANVIYSDWITPPSNTTYQYTISAPKLTQLIFDRGQIAVYMKYDNHGSDEITQLSEGTLYTRDYKIGYTAQVGSIMIRSQNVTIGSSYSFRYILIPGSVTASANIRLDNYKTLKTVFGLPN